MDSNASWSECADDYCDFSTAPIDYNATHQSAGNSADGNYTQIFNSVFVFSIN